MNFDPQKFFIGLMDFFSILLPGALLTWLLMDESGPAVLGDRHAALAGAQIKVCYGAGWLGFDGQKQILNRTNYKKLEVGLWSVGYDRAQVRVSQTTDVTYNVFFGPRRKAFAGDSSERGIPRIYLLNECVLVICETVGRGAEL